MKQALTIAGSDSSGGAGIQADLKTFQELGIYGMSVITAVTAQNTRGIRAIYPMTIEAVGSQLDAIGEDLKPAAVKTGMLGDGEMVRLVADKYVQFGWSNLVVDPVMLAKDGSELLKREAVASLVKVLLPLAEVVTPNIPEAELLAQMSIRTLQDREEAARRLVQMGARHVIVKGGHDPSDEDVSIDLLYDGNIYCYLEGKRIRTRHTHGTGCTFSAAVAAGLASGLSFWEAAKSAKHFIHAAIAESLEIGSGQGPTNHAAYRRLLEAQRNAVEHGTNLEKRDNKRNHI